MARVCVQLVLRVQVYACTCRLYLMFEDVDSDSAVFILLLLGARGSSVGALSSKVFNLVTYFSSPRKVSLQGISRADHGKSA